MKMKRLLSIFSLIAGLFAQGQTGAILLTDGATATTTTWSDLSGSSNNLTFYNTPTISSSNSGVVTFNGTNQYAAAPSGFDDFTNGITVLCFADFNGASNWERIIDFGTGTHSNNIFLSRSFTSNDLNFGLYNGVSQSLSLSLSISNGIANNSWGFYAAKADGSNAAIFNHLSTNSIVSSVLPTNITRTNNYIGKSNWSNDDFFDGSIGVLAIFDRALTDAEIAGFYNTYRSRYSLSTLPYYTANPSIVASASILNFSHCGNGVSDAQSFTISGTDLEDNITVTAPSGYEIATSQSGTYQSSLSLNLNLGNVSSTTLWVRATSAISTEASSNLSITSHNTTENIALVNGLANAVHLDGINDYMEVINTGQLDLTTMTLEGWFKPNASNDNKAIFSQRNATNSSGARYSIHMNTSSDIIGLYDGYSFTSISYDFEPGLWYHIATVMSVSSTKFYINGTLAGTINAGLNTSVTGIPFRIGAPELTSFSNEFFAGYVDEARIWNDERTATEIANNYQSSISGNETGLIAYYTFDQGIEEGSNTGNTAVKDGAGSNDGTLVNLAMNGITSNFTNGYFPDITGGSEFLVGETLQLNHIITGGTWSSANTSVATISQNGLVTGVAAGSTTITYSLCGAETTYALTASEQNSFNLDGSNDYANVTDVTLSSVSGDMTIESWLYIDVNQNGEIFTKNINSTASASVHYSLRYRGGKLMLHLGNGSSSYYYVKSTEDLPLGQWIHVAGVFEYGVGVTLYLDGESMTIDPATTNGSVNFDYSSSGSEINTIGAYRTTSTLNPYDGRIDELRIWNEARTASEIQNNMNSQVDPNSTNLVAYYRFNQGIRGASNSSETSLPDLTGNGNDAIWMNASLNSSVSNWTSGFIPPISGQTNVLISTTAQLTNGAVGGVWSSSNTGVATIDQNGLVTGVSAGTSTISYTKDANTATATISVIDGSNAGRVTIVSSGGGVEGSDWIKAGTQILSNSTSAVNINASDIISYAATEDITILGSSIIINADIATGASNTMTFSSKEDIDINSNVDISTNGGSVVFRSNNDGQGSYGSVIFYPNSAITTNGGHLWIGGGSSNATWNGLTVGDGYAVGGTSITPSSNNSDVEPAVYFESSTISTSGGSIYLAGSGQSSGTYGLVGIGVIDIDAGGGEIDFNILTNGSGYRGVSVGHHHSAIPGNFALRSSNSSSDAVSLSIDASNASSHALVTGGTFIMENTGTGGIELITSAPSGAYGIRPGFSTTISTDIQFLAVSGPILVNTNNSPIDKENNSCFITFGSKSGSNITSSTSDITVITSDLDDQFLATFNTSGSVTIKEQSGSTFTAGASLNDLTIASTVSGLTVGNNTNSTPSDISIGDQNIAGDLNIYGNNINLTGDITLSGDLNALASANISLSASKTLTSTGGNLVLWSDYDNDGSGSISAGDNTTFTTSGGNIYLAGGTDTDSDGLPNGFATSSSTHGIELGTQASSTTTMTTSGGNILIQGKCTSTTTTTGHGLSQNGLIDIDAGSGSITINGQSANWYGIDFASLVMSASTPWSIKSSATTGTAISISGTSTAASDYGVVFNFPVQKQIIADGGGTIEINGSGTGSNWGIFCQNTDFLSSSGTITLDGGVNGVKITDYGSRFGALAGSDVTSSTANVVLLGDQITVGDWRSGFSTKVHTSGTVSIQPYTTSSFGNGISWQAGTATSGWNLGKTSGSGSTTFDWETTTVN